MSEPWIPAQIDIVDALLADAPSGSWSEALARLDLTRHQDRALAPGRARQPFPSLRALAARWRWPSLSRVRRLVAQADLWALPGHPLPLRSGGVSLADEPEEADEGEEFCLGLMGERTDWTHDALVAAGFRFLTARMECAIAVSEFVSSAASIPDVIGWKRGQTHMVEAKRSRADFRADRDKISHRADVIPGQRRWYIVPAGLVRKEEVPEGWGMVWVRLNDEGAVRFRVVVDAPLVPGAPSEELKISASLARRLRDGGKICETTGRITAWREVTP